VRAAALLFGAQIPTGTIERVASSASGQGGGKRYTVQASSHNRTQRFDRRHNTVGGFAVTSIGHRLAAAAVDSIAEFGHDDDGFGLTAAADCESSRQRPALNPNGEVHATPI
jgi:hypothetical protein